MCMLDRFDQDSCGAERVLERAGWLLAVDQAGRPKCSAEKHPLYHAYQVGRVSCCTLGGQWVGSVMCR